MVYPTPALHLLISAPGDVPLADMAVIRKTISQWNLTLGRYAGLTVLPVSWTEHAVSEFGSGRRPAGPNLTFLTATTWSSTTLTCGHSRLLTGTSTGGALSGRVFSGVSSVETVPEVSF